MASLPIIQVGGKLELTANLKTQFPNEPVVSLAIQDLTNVPTLTGNAEKYLRVNALGTAIELVDGTSGGGTGTGVRVVTSLPSGLAADTIVYLKASIPSFNKGFYIYNGTQWNAILGSGSAGASTFLALSDTPSIFAPSKFLRVNQAGTAIEFVDAPSGSGASSFSQLTGMLALSQVPDGLLTEAKVDEAFKTKLNASGSGGLASVSSDSTLTGVGTSADPLKVAIPFSQDEKDKLAALSASDLPVGAKSPVQYTPSVIYHDPNKINGDHLVSLSEVIAQVEGNNTLYTQRQTGSFVSVANFNPLSVENVSYGTITAKALVITYNGNLFEDQQLIKFELIDSTGNLSKEYLFPTETIKNGFDYVVSDALADSSIHKKEIRFRIIYDSGTDKTKIFVHQRPVADPPPAVYLFIIALQKAESLSQKGEKGDPSDPQFQGRLVLSTIYTAGQIFDFDGTLIKVKAGQTFQASVDATSPTWSDTSWKALTDIRTGSLRTKLEILTPRDWITDIVPTGTTLVLKRGNEADKIITPIANLSTATGSLALRQVPDNLFTEAKLATALRTKINASTAFSALTGMLALSQVPDGLFTEAKLDAALKAKINAEASGGGLSAEAITELPEVETITDSSEFVLVATSGEASNGGILTAGRAFSGSPAADGFGVATGAFGFVKGGSIEGSVSENLLGFYVNFAASEIIVHVKTGTPAPKSFFIDGVNIAYELEDFTKDQSNTNRSWVTGADVYLVLTEADAFQSGSTYNIRITDVNGDDFITTPPSKSLLKSNFGELKKNVLSDNDRRVLEETQADTKTFGALKIAEVVLNNNNHESLAVATHDAYAKLGTAGGGWTLKKKSSNTDATQPDEFKILYLGYYLEDNTTDILIQTDQEDSFTAVVNGSSLMFNTLNSAVTYKGKQTRYNAGTITGTIKTMLDSGSYTLEVTGYDVLENTETEKINISSKWDLGFFNKEKVATFEDDDELLVNDFSGGGEVILTAGALYVGGLGFQDYGWSVANGVDPINIKGGSFNVEPPSDLIAITTSGSFLFIHVKTGTLTNIKTLIADGVSYTLTSVATNIDPSWGASKIDAYRVGSFTAFTDGQVINIKILASDGSIIFGGSPKTSKTKKSTLGQFKEELKATLGFVSDYQTILIPEYLKATPNVARDELRLSTSGSATLPIGDDALIDTDPVAAGYQSIDIAVKKTDLVGAKFIEVFHAHAPQAIATSSGLRRLKDFGATTKPFSGSFRSDRNYGMQIHRGQNQLGTASTTHDRISFKALTSDVVYIGEVRIWK